MASKYTCRTCLKGLSRRSVISRYLVSENLILQREQLGSSFRSFATAKQSSAKMVQQNSSRPSKPKIAATTTATATVSSSSSLSSSSSSVTGKSSEQQHLKPIRMDKPPPWLQRQGMSDGVTMTKTGSKAILEENPEGDYDDYLRHDGEVKFARFEPEKGMDYYRDSKGELHIPAAIPEDDLRTYKFSTPGWVWGSTERLFEESEQAQLVFKKVEVADEEGKKIKRFPTGPNGEHLGEGSGWWFDEIGLPKTLNSYAIVCLLHMWILKVRIRRFPKPMADKWTELLVHHFFWKFEERMDLIHKQSHNPRKKLLKEYFEIWLGVIISFDEGLIKGDAMLASAVWRFVFEDLEDADPVKIALVTAYLRRELTRVGQLGDRVMANGYVGFGDKVSLDEIMKGDRLMNIPFRQESLPKTTA